MFQNLTQDNDLQQERDVLGGGGVLDSAVYDCTIKMAYGSKSTGGAMALNLTLETDDKRTLRKTVYVSTKEGKNYSEKNGNKSALPGFLLATNLCLLTVQKELHQIVPEDKVIQIYDYDAKKELPTKVPVLVELIGQRISVGVIKEIVDKTTKDGAGVYQPTGETREQNEIDKFFRISDGITVAELRAKAPATFKQQWADKNTGVTKNKAKGTGGGASGSASAPKTGGASVPSAPAKSLFED